MHTGPPSFGADRRKPGVRNLSSRQGAAAFRRSLGHARRPPGRTCATGRELKGLRRPAAEWKIVAELPDWLSLSADVATYTGGAHGNYWVQGLVWDKKNEDAFDAKQFFTSPAALYEAVEERFCDGLDRERSKRREIPVEEFPDDPFAECPGIDELEVLVGSSNRRTFNRLTLYAGPYVAGPYVEGAYEVNVNVDAAVLETIKPEYREAFSARN